MTDRAEQECETLEGLWAVLFGGPPSIRCEASLLVKVMVESLPPAGPYTFGEARDGGRDGEDRTERATESAIRANSPAGPPIAEAEARLTAMIAAAL